MSHKALTSGTPEVKNEFNKGSKACEVEIKFLVPENPPGCIDFSAFNKIHKTFADRHWIKSSNEKLLLTRQLDTPDKALLNSGRSLRIRAECENADPATIQTPDICLKMGASQDKSGALRRSEYEAKIKKFDRVDFKPLLKEYPEDQFPEIHNALKDIHPEEMKEFFRIECIRRRLVVEFPESITGLKGKRFVGELLLDDVAFVLDVPGLEKPLLFHHDLEVEMEPLYQPCAYDKNPNAKNYVSSPLTPEQELKAMTAASKAIQRAADGVLIINTKSKANRGFEQLAKTEELLKSFLQPNLNAQPTRAVVCAFIGRLLSGNNDKPHHHLDKDFGPLINAGYRRFVPHLNAA